MSEQTSRNMRKSTLFFSYQPFVSKQTNSFKKCKEFFHQSHSVFDDKNSNYHETLKDCEHFSYICKIVAKLYLLKQRTRGNKFRPSYVYFFSCFFLNFQSQALRMVIMTIDDGGSDGGGEAQASNFLLFIDANQQQLTTEEKPSFGNEIELTLATKLHLV